MSNSLQPVIEVKNLSKSFNYWDDRPNSLKKIMANLISWNFSSGHHRRIDVLNDVSFKIYPGQFVGIMGRNGVGKSTILKLISGIYQPSSGEVNINGKIAPLLELGAGFSDELSGYDNIFLNAAILGFGKHRTAESLASIIEFSELGEKLHMPVRNYSSGMLIRLGFSIAVHLDAPILLFDEILAVGDIAFQKKCLEKITQLYQEGRSIILVTHSPDQVLKFCNRCIVFNNRELVYDGPTEGGVNTYIGLF